VVRTPVPEHTKQDVHGEYLDRLMRRESFSALWPLFAQATKPAKELTESFSALVHLRPFMKRLAGCRAIHIGDGAHARTAALFSLKTESENISVDPVINERIVSSWRDEYKIERFSWRKSRIEDSIEELNGLSPDPVVVSFVHAHVDVDLVLKDLRWDVAFTLACCVPGKQLTRAYTPHQEGEDLGVLSSDRGFQLLLNPDSRFL